ncbi:MAG: AcrR family transcriptional regulator [Halopseudomonas sp.]|jgi:AcrR family transcriptional regulator
MAKYDRDTALQQAVILFWRKGYSGASMKQIEQALDMRPGSLYAAFGSKDGLFSEAMDLYMAAMFQEMDEHLAQYTSITEGLRSYLRQLATSASGDSTPPARACMLVKTLLELNDGETPLQTKINSIFCLIESKFAAVLADAKRRGEVSETLDCGRMARLLQTQVMGLRSFAQREVPPEHVQMLAEDMVSMLDIQWHKGK